MPELPEVETVARDLRAQKLEGAVFLSVSVKWPRTVSTHTPRAFASALRNRTIQQVGRRGKYLLLHLDDERILLIHLRMTGKLRLAAQSDHPGAHDHIVLTFVDGRRLFFNDTRKFGRMKLIDPNDPDNPLLALGPEPLEKDFTKDRLHNILTTRNRHMKPLLLDQSVIAGLGNIYVDESLWAARIHPCRRGTSVTRQESDALHTAIRTVLRRAIRLSGTTLGSGDTNFYSVAGRRGRNADALQVFRRTGEPCPRCQTPIARTVVAQRGTHYCPTCQTL